MEFINIQHPSTTSKTTGSKLYISITFYLYFRYVNPLSVLKVIGCVFRNNCKSGTMTWYEKISHLMIVNYELSLVTLLLVSMIK